MRYFLLFLSLCMLAGCMNLSNKTLSFRSDGSVHGYFQGIDFNSLEKEWTFKTNASVRSTPLVDDGKIYVGSCDSNFYAIGAKAGNQLWKFKADAAISSSAALSDGSLFFQSRNNTLYAVSANNGKKEWDLKMGLTLQYDWGFDYYLSSPLVAANSLFVGSGDGNLYCVDPKKGNVKWKFSCSSVIRSSPSYYDGQVFFGDCDGRLYSVDAVTGTKKWQFNIVGDTLNNEKEGFDRKAIIASPVIKDNILVVGGRDGYLYAVDMKTGTEKWQFNYEVSWVITTVAIKDSTVIIGTSDGQFVNAINLYTGKEIWRAATSLVWASPLIIGNTVLTAQNDGFIYLHDLSSGAQKNKIRIGDRFFSSPAFNNEKIYVGNDDGNVYAFNLKNIDLPKFAKAVFWNKDFSPRKPWVDAYIKDYLVPEGYQLLDEDKLATFLNDHIKDTFASVVVLATNYFPEKITKDSAGTNLLYQYLHKGGKIVTTGANPAVFAIDYKNLKFQGIDYSLSKNLTGIEYPFKDLRSHKGFYSSSPTAEGLKWGLTKTVIAHSAVKPSMATALSIDENGNACYWVKNYGFKEGTGLVQFWITPERLDVINDLKRVAEYGLR